LSDPSTCWEDIEFIKSHCNLPIYLKGILHPEDAALAYQLNVRGIIVSNHGGRQLDGCPAAIDCLRLIMDRLSGKDMSVFDIFVDGGISSGKDIFKALAIGAKAVLIGRSVLWGLAYDGMNGAKQVIQMYKQELVNTMQLAGCSSINNIKNVSIICQSVEGTYQDLH